MNDSIIRLVITTLGILAALCVCGNLYLSAHTLETPPGITHIASSAVGALVGILATSRAMTHRD